MSSARIRLGQGKVIQRSHLTGFVQEVYGIFCFQKGHNWETVVECEITIFVSLRLEQKRSSLFSEECNTEKHLFRTLHEIMGKMVLMLLMG